MDLLKDFVIDTKEKRKFLEIVQADILADPSELIVITTYKENEEHDNLYSHFLNTNSKDLNLERKLIESNDGFVSVRTLSTTNQHIFFIHSNLTEGNVYHNEKLRSLFKLTFSAMAAYLYENKESDIQSIAMPVLFRKAVREESYSEYIHIFLYEATNFLRNTPKMDKLRIILWNEKDIHIWKDTILNKTKSVTKSVISQEDIHSLGVQIHQKIDNGVLKDKLPSWLLGKLKRELTKTPFHFQLFIKRFNLVIRIILDELCKVDGIPSNYQNMSPMKKALDLKSNRLIVEWLGEYITNILSINRLSEDEQFSLDMQYYYLLQVLQIVDFFENYVAKERLV